jgi:DNA-binding LytR/AlgR family response regulator
LGGAGGGSLKTMLYKCIIADDEAPARNLLKDYVAKMPNLELVSACTNAIDAKMVLSSYPIDILFLDIQMPDLTGIDLLKILPSPKPSIILTTAYHNFAVEGYQLGVTDYLLKPISFERFFQAVNKAILERTPLHQEEIASKVTKYEERVEHIFIKVNQKIIRLDLSDILYIEGFREYIKIHTKTQRHIAYQSMSKILEALPSDRFVRVHRSFIVNIQKIDSIEGNSILIGNENITISKTQRADFLKLINPNELF